jgi:TIR domain
VLYFFLSYAREDDPVFIRRFFEDLSGHVRNLAGAERSDEVGFLDEYSIRVGQRWASDLQEALSACRCFVALTSPRYFRRDHCGREWYLFHERLLSYEQRWNRSAPALLPVQWIPTSAVHPVAAEIQRAGAQLGGTPYGEYGLRQLLDLKRFRDDYRTFVFALARQIVTTAHEHVVPRPRRRIPLHQLPQQLRRQHHHQRYRRGRYAERRAARWSAGRTP